jgi:hypothetical protein
LTRIETGLSLAFTVAVAFSCGTPALAESALRMDVGYRTGDFDWSIAGDARDGPDVLSELSYSDLQVFQFRVEADLTLTRRLVTRLGVSYGEILDGESRDSDYGDDGRTLEWSRSVAETDGDELIDAAVGLGYEFWPGEQHLARVVPLVGVSYSAQNLRATDGRQTLSDGEIAARFEVGTPPLGPFDGLDSSYQAEWLGPWIGVEAEAPRGDRWGLSGRAAYHWADYEAEADWNLRDDFEHPTSFEQEANGSGFVANAAAYFKPSPAYRLYLRLDYQNWSTDAGSQRTYFSDGDRPVTRFNGANWESFTISFGVDLLRSERKFSPPLPDENAAPGSN